MSDSPKPPSSLTVAEDWDVSGALKGYGIPLGALAICGLGALYLGKRMNDLETHVGALKRNEVRHLSETDVRLIVQTMAKDGHINVTGFNDSTMQAHAQQQQVLLQQQHHLQQQLEQLKQSGYIHQQQQAPTPSEIPRNPYTFEASTEEESLAAQEQATGWVPKSKRENKEV